MNNVSSPTEDEVERGLTAEPWVARFQYLKRNDFTPTVAQVERGLRDKDHRVRWKWSTRLDFAPTTAQIENGLMDKIEQIRCQWACRMDFDPTAVQVERGLTDQSEDVRGAWVERQNTFLPLDGLNRVVLFMAENRYKALPEVLDRRFRNQAEVEQLTESLDKKNDAMRCHRVSPRVL